MFKFVDVMTMLRIKQIVDFCTATCFYLIVWQVSPNCIKLIISCKAMQICDSEIYLYQFVKIVSFPPYLIITSIIIHIQFWFSISHSRGS